MEMSCAEVVSQAVALDRPLREVWLAVSKGITSTYSSIRSECSVYIEKA